MKLDELEIAQPSTRARRHGEAVSIESRRGCGAKVNPSRSAGSQKGGWSAEKMEDAGAVLTQNSSNPFRSGEKLQHLHLLEDTNRTNFSDGIAESPCDFGPCAIATRMDDAPPGMRALQSEKEAPGRSTIEASPHADQVSNSTRPLAGENSDEGRVCEPGGCFLRILCMQLGGVSEVERDGNPPLS
jgi:hypothetical protein